MLDLAVWLILLLTVPVLLVFSKKALVAIVRDRSDPVLPPAPQTTRVACVGDSITYGFCILKRRQNNYPAVLQRLLGASYSVRNFGVTGRTAGKSGDLPYWSHKIFQKSLDFRPDVVFLMLGTNDTKQEDWVDMDSFLEDYMDLISRYRALTSKPAVYVLTPPEVYLVKGAPNRYGINKDLVDEISVELKVMAKGLGIPVIDINGAMKYHPEWFTKDGVHPDAAGAEHIARTVQEEFEHSLVYDA